jgi:hypothetical protein
MAQWRHWLVEIPAKIIDLWWNFYLILITLLTMACFVTVVLMLVLHFGFGIRWGW